MGVAVNGERDRPLSICRRIQWKSVPYGLLLFLAFSVAVVVLDIGSILFGPNSLRGLVLEYCGWSPSVIFMFAVFICMDFLDRRSPRALKGLTQLMLIQSALGLWEIYHRSGRENYDNPYLNADSHRYVWAVVVPIVWIAALHTKRVRSYATTTEGGVDARR